MRQSWLNIFQHVYLFHSWFTIISFSHLVHYNLNGCVRTLRHTLLRASLYKIANLFSKGKVNDIKVCFNVVGRAGEFMFPCNLPRLPALRDCVIITIPLLFYWARCCVLRELHLFESLWIFCTASQQVEAEEFGQIYCVDVSSCWDFTACSLKQKTFTRVHSYESLTPILHQCSRATF